MNCVDMNQVDMNRVDMNRVDMSHVDVSMYISNSLKKSNANFFPVN